MTPESVATVYSRPGCGQCTATVRALDSHEISFTLVDLSQDPAAVLRVRELGYQQVPVVVAGSDHWSGFRPDKISQLAEIGEEFGISPATVRRIDAAAQAE